MKYWLFGAGLAFLTGPAAAQQAEQEPLQVQRVAMRAAEEQLISLDIPAQPIGDALTEFARQSGLNVIFHADSFEDLAARQGRESRAKEAASNHLLHTSKPDPLMAPAVAGLLTPEEALTRLLEGVPLRYEFVNDRTIAIRKLNSSELGPDASSTPAASPQGVRLSQAEDAPPARVSRTASEAGASDSAQAGDLEEIVVTGSHIRGTQVPVGSDLIVLDQVYFQRTGFTTLEDVLRTLPQAAPGPNQADALAGVKSGTQYVNWGRGTGINLRGLGAGATLVLVDGMRQASSGTGGTFVDVSNIPLTAIERIEVLPDGASATYGADAVGGVVNIIMKKKYSGFESRVSFGTLDGDSNELRVTQLAGTSWDGGSFFGGLEYYSREGLSAQDRAYSADSDQRRNGGDNFSSLQSFPANIMCFKFDGSCTFGQPVFAIPAGQDGTKLTVADLVPVGPDLEGANFYNINLGSMLVPEVRKTAAFLTLSQELGSRMELQTSLRYNRQPIDYATTSSGAFLIVPASNPYYIDVFGDSSDLFVNYAFGETFPLRQSGHTDTYFGSLAASMALKGGWRAKLTSSYARQAMQLSQTTIDALLLSQAVGGPSFPGLPVYDPEVEGYFNPFAGEATVENTNVLNKLVSTNSEAATWRTTEHTLLFDGPLFVLPAGKAQVAFGAGYRAIRGDSGNGPQRLGGLDESVRSAFVETQVPLFGAANARRGLHELKLSVAGRYEEYVGYQETFNPKVGIAWSPVAPITVRATWGTSFRAPSPADRDTTVFNFGTAIVIPGVADPASPTGTSTALFLGGGVHPDLHEERAKSWTAGVDFRVGDAVSPFRASITYYSTRYTDRIGVGGIPGQELDILLNEDAWGEIIIRNPSTELIDELCAPPAGDGTCSLANPSVILDFRTRNIAVQINRGVDLQIEKMFSTRSGNLGFIANVNRVLNNETGLSETSQRVDVLDQPGAPLKWRARASVYWDFRGISASASISHWPSYRDPTGGSASEPRSVDSWTTADLTFQYQSGSGGRWWDNSVIALKVVNAFDSEPPYLNHSLGYDSSNANPYGRMTSLEISKSW